MFKFLTSQTRELLLLLGLLSLLWACGKGPGYSGTLKATPTLAQSPNLNSSQSAETISAADQAEIAAEFKRIAEDLVSVTHWKEITSTDGIDLIVLRAAVQNTAIKTVTFEIQLPDLSLGAQQSFVHPLCSAKDPGQAAGTNTFAKFHVVDAINCAEPARIILNTKNWKALTQQLKSRLVVQQYLGILNIEDRDFSKSLQFLKSLAP
jgi:hypothetical protein